MSSGGKSGTTSPQYNYFGTVAGIFGNGPMDVLSTILIGGGRILWSGTLTRGAETYVDLTGSIDPNFFTGGGYLRWYWGTETQPADAALPGHPPYKGRPMLVAKNFLFGTDVTTAPDFQVIGARKPVVDGSIVAAIDNVLDDGQVNPIAAVAELVLSPAGLNVPLARLKAASWLAVAAAMNASAAVRGLRWCSPLLMAFQPARSVLADLLLLCDCELRWTVDGLLDIVARRWGVDPGGLPTFDARHCSDGAPQALAADGWDAVPANAEVAFVNRAKLFKNDSVPTPNLWAQQDPVSSFPNRQLQRDQVARSSQAALIGAEFIRQNDQPRGTLSRTLRRPLILTAAGQAVLPGDKVYIDVDPVPGGGGLAQLAIVEQVAFGRTGPVKIRATADTLVPEAPYAPAWAVPSPQVYTVDPVADALAIPLPPAAYGLPPAVGLLLARPGAKVVGAQVFFDTDAGGGFPELGKQTGFAVRCGLVNDAALNDTTLRLALTDGLNGPDAALAARTPENALAAQQGQLLLILASVDGSGRVTVGGDGLPEMEIVFLDGRTAVAGATFDYTGLRGQQGLAARAWSAAGTTAWIIPAVNLTAWQHPAFAGLAASGAPGHLRVASYSAFAEDETSPPPGWSFVIPAINLNAPITSYPRLAPDTGDPTDGQPFDLGLVLDQNGGFSGAGTGASLTDALAVIDAHAGQIYRICVVSFGTASGAMFYLTTDVAGVRAWLAAALAGTNPPHNLFYFNGGAISPPEAAADGLYQCLGILDTAATPLRRFVYLSSHHKDFSGPYTGPAALVNTRLNGPLTYAFLAHGTATGGGTLLDTALPATSRVVHGNFP